MKNRGTYILLVLFFAGMVGLWVADFTHLPTRRDRERMSGRILYELVDAKPEELEKIEILGGESPIVFVRKPGNRWQMTSPMNVAADPSKVEALAYNLKELSRKPEADTLEGDPARFGLAPPERIIRLWGKSSDAPLASLEVGKVSLDRRYVRHVGSSGAEVVDARGLDLLKLPPTRWRDHELFRVPSLEVDSVKLSGGGKQLELRRGRNAWRITSPFPTLATESKVEGLIADLGTLKVLDDTRFVANDVGDAELDRYGLKTPSLTIEVDAGRINQRREPQVLHVGKPVPGKDGLVYALRGKDDDVVAIDTRVLKDLRPDPNSFRSPKVADVNPARVTRIGVEDASGAEFQVVRTGNGWVIANPTLALADHKTIEDFLNALDRLQTSIYPSSEVVPDPGVAKPSLTLKIWQARDPREPPDSASTGSKELLALAIKIGRHDAGRKSIYAQLVGDPTVLALPDTIKDALPRNSLSFRDRQVLVGSTDHIERIKFLGETRKFTLNSPVLKLDPLGKGPLGWWLVEPIDAPADSESVGQLLKTLSNLRADSLVAEKSDDLQKYGLKVPALTLTWSNLPPFSLLRPTTSTISTPGTLTLDDHSLMIGAAVPGHPNVRYAKLSDAPLIFTVGPDVLRVLDSEWRDHRVLSFSAKHVRKIQLSWPDRGVTLDATRSGNGRTWSIASSTDGLVFTPNPERIETLVKGCSELSTNRFVQYSGEFPPSYGLTSPPLLSIRFELDDGSRPRTIKVGALAAKGQLLATAEEASSGPIFLVPDSLFGTWLRPPRNRDDLPDDVMSPDK
jgi:Domain of unknown function (DUF4340)